MFKKPLIVLFLLISFIYLMGCITAPLNQRHYNFYYDAGGIAEANGNLELAQKNYSRALWYAISGLLGAEKQAWATYEWARITGYLGDFEESKKAFIDAIQLLEKSKGKDRTSITPMFCELGNLYHDNEFHAEAVKMYSQAMPLLETRNVSEEDPIGYAVFLENYAESLEKSGDKEQGTKIYQKAQTLRKNNINKEALYIPKRYK